MKGFTLIETIIAIAVFLLALGVVAGFLLLGYRTQTYAFQQSQAIGEARRGVEQMAKELREATAGEDGSYLLEKADDYELIFYSDIDKDQQVELVHYVINPAGGESGSATQFCTSLVKGGSCSVNFSDFAQGTLQTATVQVSVEGDLNGGSETVEIFGDGAYLGMLCSGGSGCGQCPGAYQGLTSFDVTSQAADNAFLLLADGSGAVDPICDWQEENHSIAVKAQFSWQTAPSAQTTAVFQKIVTQPAGWPPTYTGAQENITVSEHARNEARGLPVFTYYDKDNNVLSDPASRLNDTTMVRLELIINVNPERAPDDFSVETNVQLRNLRPSL